MILCVNANAAIDKTVVVRGFRLNEIHRPESVMSLPGGKGANCAKGLRTLGEQTCVTGWVGGHNGRFIEDGLRSEGIETAFVHVDFESRTCLSILDPESGVITEIYERGDPIPEEKIAGFKELFGSMVGGCEAVTLSGSLPPGVPDDLYAQLIDVANAAGVPVFLDSSGEPLKKGVELSRPLLVKPNAKEIAVLVGHEAVGLEQLTESAAEIARIRGAIVALSMGKDGLLVAQGDEVFQARPPKLEVKSAVGSGDCLLAGLTYGITHDMSLREAARYGVAAGTANALTVGAGVFSIEDFRRVLALVEVCDT